jgi:putative Holliday junction resolvase
MRVLGLDVGSRTIGVAVTDELGVAAHPVTTLARRGTARDVVQVHDLAATYHTDRVVLGIPYEGEAHEARHRAERVRVLGRALAASGLHVEECDESYSTVEAEEVLLEADLSRRKRKRAVDRLAAAVILERWLARHEGPHG